MLSFIAKFRDDEKGATAVEYGLIVGLLVIAMMTALNSVATTTINMWVRVADSTSKAVQSVQ